MSVEVITLSVVPVFYALSEEVRLKRRQRGSVAPALRTEGGEPVGGVRLGGLGEATGMVAGDPTGVRDRPARARARSARLAAALPSRASLTPAEIPASLIGLDLVRKAR